VYHFLGSLAKRQNTDNVTAFAQQQHIRSADDFLSQSVLVVISGGVVNKSVESILIL